MGKFGLDCSVKATMVSHNLKSIGGDTHQSGTGKKWQPGTSVGMLSHLDYSHVCPQSCKFCPWWRNTSGTGRTSYLAPKPPPNNDYFKTERYLNQLIYIPVNAYQCFCTAGWKGEHCNQDVNECESSPCQNGGICSTDAGTADYDCACAQGFRGSMCQTDVDECASAPCQHGECIDSKQDQRLSGFQYLCKCHDGWSGYNCEVDDDDCISSPCMNGGSCTDEVNGWNCTCINHITLGKPGSNTWEGPRCETEIDPCQVSEDDCDNKTARCIHVGAGIHECLCHPGYETADGGKDCTPIQECVSSPCMNGGTCNEGKCTDAACIFQWTCTCPNGWAGETCHIDLDECASYPCTHGATCVDGVWSYNCVCTAGHHGYNCEIDIDECDSDPCQNGGTCIDSAAMGRIARGYYLCRCALG